MDSASITANTVAMRISYTRLRRAAFKIILFFFFKNEPIVLVSVNLEDILSCYVFAYTKIVKAMLKRNTLFQGAHFGDR